MGDLNGRVRRSMAEGGLYGTVVECLRDVNAGNERLAKNAVREHPRKSTTKL